MPITLSPQLEADVDTLRQFLDNVRPGMLKEGEGILPYKYLEPGASYTAVLWDWDSFFCSVSQRSSDQIGPYAQGCVLNFLSRLREDGSLPYAIQAYPSESHLKLDINVTRRGTDTDRNSAKPLLAQMALLAAEELNDFTWLSDAFPMLVHYLKHWEQTQQTRFGLFTWRSHRGSGTDNHPALYGRPRNSTAGVDLNVFFVREYRAMAAIAKALGMQAALATFTEKTKTLCEAINRHMWDPIDGLYYHVDPCGQTMPNTTQEVDWVVPLKFRAWTAFLPMWAQVATEENARRMVEEHLSNEAEYWCRHGIRTLARNEPLHNLEPTSNPSNWQGPVWIVSNYLVFRGLMNYGYRDLAETLMARTVSLLANDIRTHDAMHELYHTETGQGLMNKGFLNWNPLGLTMWEEFTGNRDFTALPWATD